MTIQLSPELEALVQQKVTDGSYPSMEQVMVEALRALDERDQQRQAQLEELRREVALGLQQLDQGQYVEGEVLFAQLREKGRRIREAGA